MHVYGMHICFNVGFDVHPQRYQGMIGTSRILRFFRFVFLISFLQSYVFLNLASKNYPYDVTFVCTTYKIVLFASPHSTHSSLLWLEYSGLAEVLRTLAGSVVCINTLPCDPQVLRHSFAQIIRDYIQ